MKPDSWKKCPHNILENILWDCDLEYDHYEGSKAETVHTIQCGNVYSTNDRIITEYWENLSDEDFDRRCKHEIENLERQLANLKKLIDGV